MPGLLAAAATLAVLAVAGALAAAAVVGAGLYDIGADRQHWQITHTLLETTMRQSVRWRARAVGEPPPHDAGRARRGAACYREHCAQCHGAPGVAPAPMARSMQPLPGPLVDAGRHWGARELYWITRHGIKMSGMPAWRYRLADGEIWDLVAFVQQLPDLSAAGYAQSLREGSGQASCGASATEAAAAPSAPDPRRGREALHQYACNACHVIPGVTGSQVHVGPPLAGFGRRELIAGTLPNDADNLARWLVHTQQIKPGTAMPEMGVTPRDAQDMAAYLLTLQ